MDKNLQPKVPIIMSSEPARKKYEDNLLKLQNYESQYQNVPTITEKPKQVKPVQFNA